jgi:hypothetical protein
MSSIPEKMAPNTSEFSELRLSGGPNADKTEYID